MGGGGLPVYLKLFFQLLPQCTEFLQAFAEVNMSVELDEGLDEIGHAPLRFDLVAAADVQFRNFTPHDETIEITDTDFLTNTVPSAILQI